MCNISSMNDLISVPLAGRQTERRLHSAQHLFQRSAERFLSLKHLVTQQQRRKIFRVKGVKTAAPCTYRTLLIHKTGLPMKRRSAAIFRSGFLIGSRPKISLSSFHFLHPKWKSQKYRRDIYCHRIQWDSVHSLMDSLK